MEDKVIKLVKELEDLGERAEDADASIILRQQHFIDNARVVVRAVLAVRARARVEEAAAQLLVLLLGERLAALVVLRLLARPVSRALHLKWGAMGVAVVWSMVCFLSAKVSSDSGDDKDGLLVIAPGVQRWLKMSIVLGMAIIFIWLVNKEGLGAYSFSMTGSILLCAMVMVGLGAILSLQIGSSASPVSGTVFVTTLVLCATALALGRNSIDDVLILTPLLVGACVAVCTANDSSQDYKTLQLCGVPVQSGFFAQILGLLLAAIAVPFALSVAHEAYTLGSPELGAPQATMFASVFDAILISKEVPLTPVLIGALAAALAEMTEQGFTATIAPGPLLLATTGGPRGASTFMPLAVGTAMGHMSELLPLAHAAANEDGI